MSYWVIAPGQDTTGIDTSYGSPKPGEVFGRACRVPLNTIEVNQVGIEARGVRYFARLEGQTSKPPALPDSFYVP